MKIGSEYFEISKKFPTMQCENVNCQHRFMLFGVSRVNRDIDDVRIIPQVSENLYCPYCGKKGS